MELTELQKLIYDAGIIGAGGAGFPTHRKLSDKTEIIVVNAAECEPLMMVDHHIMQKHLHLIVDTLNMLMDTMGAKEAIIGIKGKNMHLLDSKVVKEMKGTRISVKEIPDIYPAGDEVVLTYETTGRIVPEGGIPIAVGVMVTNLETLFNIWKLFNEDTPVVEKYVTIGGDTKDKDLTVKVPVGMKVKELLAACGYDNLEGKCVINGGPMMGKLVDLENDVVTKTTKGLLIFPETHEVIQLRKRPLSVNLKRAAAACCECHMCSDMCPRMLMGYNFSVHKVLRAASHSQVCDTKSFLQSSLCCGCGVCTVVACQQMLDPREISMAVKGELAKQGFKYSSDNHPKEVRAERAGRLVSSDVLVSRLGVGKYLKPVVRDMRPFNPEKVYILTKQHVGAPATVLVKVGDKVKRGDAVARTPYEILGTTMHSSIDGVVTRADNDMIVIERRA